MKQSIMYAILRTTTPIASSVSQHPLIKPSSLHFTITHKCMHCCPRARVFNPGPAIAMYSIYAVYQQTGQGLNYSIFITRPLPQLTAMFCKVNDNYETPELFIYSFDCLFDVGFVCVFTCLLWLCGKLMDVTEFYLTTAFKFCCMVYAVADQGEPTSVSTTLQTPALVAF